MYFMDRSLLISGLVLALLCEGTSSALAAPPPQRWKEADFGGVLSVGLEGHRNFETGKKHFTKLCTPCHQMGALGGGSASDLSKRSLTYSPEELLAHLLSDDKHPRKSGGLIDGLSQSDVLDLLAFLLSGADSQSPFFFNP
jgi:hypothetical protein